MIHRQFEMIEYTEISKGNENLTSIDIPLPSSTWNVTSLELNFTNIKLGREVKTIEDNATYYMDLNKFTHCLAVQINISEPTTLFGVEMFIQNVSSLILTHKEIFVQINNYSSSTEKPTNIIPGSQVEVNITRNPGWHVQYFPSPIDLPIGNYSLVLNGTDIGLSPQPIYFWYNNIENPKYPDLYTWEYKSGSWQTGVKGTTLLHKLIQKTNKTYNPESINMSLEINQVDYNVLNGPFIGTGYVIIPNLLYSPGVTNIHIPIKNNESVLLDFNVNYYINLTKILLVNNSYVKIYENLDNDWRITPNISKPDGNYSIRFYYPKSWYNLTIFRNNGAGWENITSEVLFTEDFLQILGTSISIDSNWLITANSPSIDFTLNIPNDTWKTEQTLQFSVQTPITDGSLTFILEYPIGFEEIIEVKQATSEQTIIFELYLNSTIFYKGDYIAKIYWNNETDAGVQSQEFQIIEPSTPFTLDLKIILDIILLAVGVSAAGIISYWTIKKMRTKKIEEEHKIYSKCMDIMNLDSIIVTNKRSGLSIYEQNFTSKELNGTLISGFLQALSSFGIELMKVENQSQTIKLEYKESIVLMSEFVNIRLILIMRESPSKYLLYSLEDLAYETYKNYGDMIEQFNGDVRKFKGIEDLLIKHLNVSIIYPLSLASIDQIEKIRINPTEKSFINNAISIMKKKNINTFYIKELLPEKSCSPKDIEIILKLIGKNIFQVAI
ncbi:MAG: hypothetical protein ACFE8L_08995 [Candidatus Hodarchaeota archaeon]